MPAKKMTSVTSAPSIPLPLPLHDKLANGKATPSRAGKKSSTPKEAKVPKTVKKEEVEGEGSAQSKKVNNVLKLNVQVSKCVSYLKNALNEKRQEEINRIREEHKDIFSTRDAILENIKTMTKNKEPKEVIEMERKKLKDFMSSEATGPLRDDKIKKKMILYRVNYNASIIVSLLVDRIVEELTHHLVHKSTTTQQHHAPATGKIGKENLQLDKLSGDDTLIFGGVYKNLLPEILCMDFSQDEVADEIDSQLHGSKKRQPFQQLVLAKFKLAKKELNVPKLQVTQEAKDIISCLAYELIKRLTCLLEILVTNIVKAQTITEVHIYTVLHSYLFIVDSGEHRLFDRVMHLLHSSVGDLFEKRETARKVSAEAGKKKKKDEKIVVESDAPQI